MIFTLKNYNDLGRCSYGTLMDSFDTEKDEIFVNGKKVEIRSVSDLFPYLWQSAGSGSHIDGMTTAHFFGPGTHWHRDYDERIKEHRKKAEKLEKMIQHTVAECDADKYVKKYYSEVESYQNLESLVARLDIEMEEQKKMKFL